jgi:hypothetical protein
MGDIVVDGQDGHLGPRDRDLSPDTLAMRQDLHERKRILLLILNRLLDGWTRTGDLGRDPKN